MPVKVLFESVSGGTGIEKISNAMVGVEIRWALKNGDCFSTLLLGNCHRQNTVMLCSLGLQKPIRQKSPLS